MKKFDFKLTRERQHYIDCVDGRIEEAKLSTIISVLSKWNAEGLYFEMRRDSICGIYIEQFPLIRSGEFYVIFKGRFEEDETGCLHFKGRIFPSFLHTAFYIILLAVIVFFALDLIFAWLIFVIAFSFYIMVTAKLIGELKRKLCEFFV